MERPLSRARKRLLPPFLLARSTEHAARTSSSDRPSSLYDDHSDIRGLGSLDAFYRLDQNDDNRLSRAELGSTRATNSFTALDTDGDNRITLSEWPWSHRSFDEQDANGDRVITAR